jgi:hypothetical protein
MQALLKEFKKYFSLKKLYYAIIVTLCVRSSSEVVTKQKKTKYVDAKRILGSSGQAQSCDSKSKPIA